MIIWLHDHLFSEKRQSDLHLLTLLRNAVSRRHTLIISKSPNSPFKQRTSPNFDLWIKKFPAKLQKELMVILEHLHVISANATVRGSERLLVSEKRLPDGIAGCHISLEEAVLAAAQSLYVLVENQINDAAFLRRVMPPAWGRKLLEWEKTGQLRYEHGGGISTMKDIVEFYSQDNNAKMAFGLPAQLWKLTHFIIYDHDGDDQNSPSENSKKLEKACSENNCHHSHRLHRRGQEYYLPKESLLFIVKNTVTGQDQEDKTREINNIFTDDKTRKFSKPLGVCSNFKKAFIGKINHGHQGVLIIPWNQDWFRDDGAWPEMTELAEKSQRRCNLRGQNHAFL